MVAAVALVTGGARRVGREIALALHRRGLRLVVHCNRSRGEADALAADMNKIRLDSAAVVQGDLLETKALPNLADKALAAFGRLDVLVNNASSFYATPVGDITEESWRDLMGSNLKAPLFLTQALAPALMERGGAVVNIVDIHAERPMAGYVVYSIAKAGLVAMTRSLAGELGPKVRVNAVAPGPVLWPEDDVHFGPAEQVRIVEHTALKRAGSPQDIAGAAAFLALDAPYVTGVVLPVDGGRSVRL